MEKKKIGICQWCLAERGPKGLQIAAQMGYAGMEMDLSYGKAGYDLTDPAVLQAYLTAKEAAGIETPSLAFNGVNLNDPAKRTERLAIMKKSIDTAVALNAKVLQLPSFFDGGMRTEAEFIETAESLKLFCQMAAPHGIIVGTENQLDVPQNLRLIETVGEDNFAVYFDNANPYLFDDRDGMAMAEELYPYLCETHIKDFSLKGKKPCVPLGQGGCHAEDFMRFLKEKEYDKWIVVENDLCVEELEKDAQWVLERM